MWGESPIEVRLVHLGEYGVDLSQVESQDKDCRPDAGGQK